MFLGPIIIPVAFFYFSHFFPNRYPIINAFENYIIISIAIGLLLIVPTNIIVKGILPTREVAYGIGNLIYGVYFFFYVSYGFGILAYKYVKSKGIEHTQLSYVLLGMFISTIIGVATNLVLPLLGTSKYNALGPSLSFIFVCFTAYAIVTARLMDIEVVIRKSLIYSIITAIITGLYVISVYFISLLFRNLTGYDLLWFTIPAIFVFAVIFQPLKDRVQDKIDQLFYPEKENFRKVIKDLSGALSTKIDIEQIMTLIGRTLERELKIEHVQVGIGNKKETAGNKPQLTLPINMRGKYPDISCWAKRNRRRLIQKKRQTLWVLYAEV